MTEDSVHTPGPAAGGRRPATSVFTLVLTGGVLLSGLSCTPQRPAEPLVDGYLSKTWVGGSLYWDRYVEVYDYERSLPEIPTVLLNGQELDFLDYGGFYATYESNSGFPIDTTYNLDVSHYWGDARARVYMPGDFTVTGPDSTYGLGLDSLLTITWQKARGATSYLIDLSLGYYYTDSQKSLRDTGFDIDTVVSDTFCQYARNHFFPAVVQTVDSGTAVVDVTACDGPQSVPGAKGNIQGAGYGFFFTNNEAPEVGFNVGQPILKRLNQAAPAGRDRERRTQRLRQMSGIPAD
jgi:hypothetical protein